MPPSDDVPRRARRVDEPQFVPVEDELSVAEPVAPASARGIGNTLTIILAVGVPVVLLAGGFVFITLGKRAARQAEQAAQEAAAFAAGRDVPWGESLNAGPITVGVVSVRVDRYEGRSPAGNEQISKDTALIVVLQIKTEDKTREHSAKGSVDVSRAYDSRGNRLTPMEMRTEFGFRCRIDGQLESGSSYVVRSDKPLSDVLVFSRPVEAAGDLVLKIDADRFGYTSAKTINFFIPASAWNPPPKPTPPPQPQRTPPPSRRGPGGR